MTHKYSGHAATPALPAGTRADVWDLGGTTPVYPWPTAAGPLRIAAGGNPADTAAGLGAREVTIYGLDENFEEVSESLATAGASASADTVNNFIRVFDVHVTESGAYGAANTGDISIETNPGGVVLAAVLAGFGSAQMSMYTIPATARSAYLKRFDVAVESNKVCDVTLWHRPSADVIAAPFEPPRVIKRFLGMEGPLSYESDEILFLPKTDIWISATPDSGGGGSRVSTILELIIVE